MKIKKRLQPCISNILIGFALTIIASCQNGGKQSSNGNVVTNLFSKKVVDLATTSQKVQSFFAEHPSYFIFEKDTFFAMQQLKDLYAANNYECIWLTNAGITKNATMAIEAIEKLEEDGMNTKGFGLQKIAVLIKNIEQNKGTDSAAVQLEIILSTASILAANASLHGQYKSELYNEDWFNSVDSNFNAGKYVANKLDNDSVKFMFADLLPIVPEYVSLKNKLKQLKTMASWQAIQMAGDSLTNIKLNDKIVALRKRLFAEIGLPKDTTSDLGAEDLLVAVKQFQYLQDIKQTGIIDTTTIGKLNASVAQKISTIKINMERLRWIQQKITYPNIWVNIPKMELQYRLQDSVPFKMRVVVGRTSRATPTLNAMLSNVVINPGWSVPPTIMKEEIVPGISKRGGSYLSRRGLKAFYRGREVDASRINESNYKMFTIQQKPGVNSALGAVKFNMPNRHAIYLHDTPHREDFVKHYRAYSSGCIRVEKPRDFAEFVLQDTNYSRNKIDSFIYKKITKEVPMKSKVEVHIVYLTNAIDSAGNVLFLRDIYSKDAAMRNLYN